MAHPASRPFVSGSREPFMYFSRRYPSPSRHEKLFKARGTTLTNPLLSLMLLQVGVNPCLLGHARGASRPRYMVSLLPGQCRGAALEVDELADKHDALPPADQGVALCVCQYLVKLCRGTRTLTNPRCYAEVRRETLERVQSNAAASTSAEQQTSPPRRERITCDYSLLAACVHELRHRWLPAKVDQVGLLWSGYGASASLLYLKRFF